MTGPSDLLSVILIDQVTGMTTRRFKLLPWGFGLRRTWGLLSHLKNKTFDREVHQQNCTGMSDETSTLLEEPALYSSEAELQPAAPELSQKKNN